MLTAEQLLMAAASDDGALQAARILSRKQRGGDLTFATARQVLVQNVCRAITRAVKQAKEGLLISSIVQRFLLDLPLRLLVLLLGRLLPLLRSTATTGAPMLEASGKTSGQRAGPARIMHTMAKINPQEHCAVCRGLWPSPLSPHLLASNYLPCPLPPSAEASPRQQARWQRALPGGYPSLA